MADLEDVVRIAQTEMKRIGDNSREAHESLRSELSNKASKSDLDVIVKDKLDAFSAVAKDRMDGQVSSIQSRIDQIEVAIKRAGGNISGKTETPEEREYKSVFESYIRRGGDDRKLQELHDVQSKSMLSGSDPNGGYLVEPTISLRVVERVLELSPIRQIAQVETVSSNGLELPVDTDVAGADWVDEMSPRNETSAPKLGKKRITVHTLHAAPQATQQLLEDAAVDIGAWLSRKVGQAFALKEGRAFTLGNGRGQPRGFLTYAPGIAPAGTETLPVVMTGAPAGFPDGNGTADALIAMVYSLKAAYRARASWLMPRSLQFAIRTMKDDRGNYLWQPGIQAGQPDRLLGFPVYDAEDMPAMAVGSLSIAFGDWQAGYTIVDRLGIQTMRDPFTKRPFVVFDTIKRVGGDVVNFEALVLMKTGVKNAGWEEPSVVHDDE